MLPEQGGHVGNVAGHHCHMMLWAPVGLEVYKQKTESDTAPSHNPCPFFLCLVLSPESISWFRQPLPSLATPSWRLKDGRWGWEDWGNKFAYFIPDLVLGHPELCFWDRDDRLMPKQRYYKRNQNQVGGRNRQRRPEGTLHVAEWFAVFGKALSLTLTFTFILPSHPERSVTIHIISHILYIFVYACALYKYKYIFQSQKLRLSVAQLVGGRAGIQMQLWFQGRPGLRILCHLPLEAPGLPESPWP